MRAGETNAIFVGFITKLVSLLIIKFTISKAKYYTKHSVGAAGNTNWIGATVLNYISIIHIIIEFDKPIEVPQDSSNYSFK